MGGKAPKANVPEVQPTPTAPQDNVQNPDNLAAGQETDQVKKRKEALAARAAAASTILTGPGGLDNATAQVGKLKLGA